ncbi:hypothetical protein [Aurantimonas sp. Leaf443]|uniref:hypothetical protein n=1 Tax=Aurantimonas sp. Leaf443 TaxID=1736378 RepID=UPI0012E38C22|nr:hypothetical protein [Aurantimonas sp. Leaf443]
MERFYSSQRPEEMVRRRPKQHENGRFHGVGQGGPKNCDNAARKGLCDSGSLVTCPSPNGDEPFGHGVRSWRNW